MASSSANQQNSAVSGGTGSVNTPANSGSTTNRRGSGAQTGGLFSGLMNQKRNSTDATANARRQSFADMKPEPGVIGKMWNNWTTGSSPPK